MAARAAVAAPATLLRGVRLGGSWQRAVLLAPAVIILLAFLTAGIFADLISAYDPEQIVLVERLIHQRFRTAGASPIHWAPTTWDATFWLASCTALACRCWSWSPASRRRR